MGASLPRPHPGVATAEGDDPVVGSRRPAAPARRKVQVAVEFAIEVPEPRADGVYANFLTAWHTSHEFTFDFSVTEPPRQVGDDLVVPVRVVARVKIPPTLVFDLIQTINNNLSRYEARYGKIPSSGIPESPEGLA